ncbi:hypothetical protein G6F35_019087 [Rhizopus arrhizus]|nr:hypothetical protein G6F35_019087 [Rhizopus arrhizus]
MPRSLVGGAELHQVVHRHDADGPLHVVPHDRIHADGAGDGRARVAVVTLLAEMVGAGDSAEHDVRENYCMDIQFNRA